MMPSTELPPRFQLAFRRCLFYTIALAVWLLLGTVLFPVLAFNFSKEDDNMASLYRLDAKRSDLLNVLWAETITNNEDDWSQLADQKLELYEKVLLQHYGIDLDKDDKTFGAGLQKAFSLTSTIGPLDVDDFSATGKVVAVLYALIGTPLFLTVLNQMIRMITSIWTGTTLCIVTVVYIFVSAVIYDIVEGGQDDVPFAEALFSIFLQFTSVGEVDNEFHGVLPYIICLFGLALITTLFTEIQHKIEHVIHPFEFAFNSTFGGIERWISQEHEKKIANDVIEEEDEENADDDY